MNNPNQLTKKLEEKMKSDEQQTLLQLQAAYAFKNGDFAEMFRCDRLALQLKRQSHNSFFNAGVNAILAKQRPVIALPPVQPKKTDVRTVLLAQSGIRIVKSN